MKHGEKRARASYDYDGVGLSYKGKKNQGLEIGPSFRR